jgi:uncharacterized protein YkwD
LFLVAGVGLLIAPSIAVLAGSTRAAVGIASGSEPIRLVLSTSALTSSAAHVTTSSLYAKHDPWIRYLATEQECPGGERTDLPPLRQARTVACLVNFARRQRGLRELAMAAPLNGASAMKVREINRCGRFAHNPCGGDWAAPIRSTGYLGAFGENLYLASGLFAAPRPAVDAWLNSARHRENLFTPEWREQGLAVAVLPSLGSYRNVVVWVNVFGNPAV